MQSRSRLIVAATFSSDANRQNPRNFQDKDPDDFYVRETEFPGNGLFVKRFFRKGDYLLSYRGDRLNFVEEDSVYVFDVGKPESILIDATRRPECKGRYINDIDPFSVQNCHPVKCFNEKNEDMICFYSTKNIDAGSELRYNYKTNCAPWRKVSFFSKLSQKKTRKKPVPLKKFIQVPNLK